MRLAETVTFAAAPADRDASRRGDPVAILALAQHPDTRFLPIWRGKPLLSPDGAGWLASGHPALMTATSSVYLGHSDGAARFARDISDWSPDPTEPAPQTAFLDPTEQHHPDLPADWRFAELRSVMATLPLADAALIATAKALTGWHALHGFCAACGAATEVAQAGWQRNCPACGRSHFPRTDPVVIMLVTHGNRVLLGRSGGWPEGMFSLLAGFMEPGESVETAVRREVAEETGVRVGPVRYLASQPWPYPSSIMIGCAAAAQTDAITLDPVELEDARWVTREEMVQVFAHTHPQIRAPRPGAIAGFLLANWLADRLD